MSTRRILTLIVLILLSTQPSFASSLRVERDGALIGEYSLESLKKLTPPETVTVFEPHEQREQRYTGFALIRLLTKFYPEWTRADEVVFLCADGYQAAVPTSQIQKHKSLLVFEREANPEFTIDNKLQAEKKVPLGPFYLVWDNLNSKELRSQGANNWPYQVVAIRFAALKNRYPHSVPPEKSAPQVHAGFKYFRNHCMTCHKVNGDGGDKGPELNHPASVTEYWKEDWLRKFIWDPRSVRSNSAMPALKDSGTKQDLEDLVAYLKRMKSTGPGASARPN